jgi:hypothetical protein
MAMVERGAEFFKDQEPKPVKAAGSRGAPVGKCNVTLTEDTRETPLALFEQVGVGATFGAASYLPQRPTTKNSPAAFLRSPGGIPNRVSVH